MHNYNLQLEYILSRNASRDVCTSYSKEMQFQQDHNRRVLQWRHVALLITPKKDAAGFQWQRILLDYQHIEVRTSKTVIYLFFSSCCFHSYAPTTLFQLQTSFLFASWNYVHNYSLTFILSSQNDNFVLLVRQNL